MDSYGDGSEIKTIEINRVRFDKTKNAINRKHMFLSEPEAESGDYYHSESVERLVEAAREAHTAMLGMNERLHPSDLRGQFLRLHTLLDKSDKLKEALEPFKGVK